MHGNTGPSDAITRVCVIPERRGRIPTRHGILLALYHDREPKTGRPKRSPEKKPGLAEKAAKGGRSWARIARRTNCRSRTSRIAWHRWWSFQVTRIRLSRYPLQSTLRTARAPCLAKVRSSQRNRPREDRLDKSRSFTPPPSP